MTEFIPRAGAVEAAREAFDRSPRTIHGTNGRLRAAIAAFCEAEGLTVEEMDRVLPDELIPEQRLVGPWRAT